MLILILVFCLNFHFHFKGSVDSLFFIPVQNESKISQHCNFFWSINSNSLSHANDGSSGGCCLHGAQCWYVLTSRAWWGNVSNLCRGQPTYLRHPNSGRVRSVYLLASHLTRRTKHSLEVGSFMVTGTWFLGEESLLKQWERNYLKLNDERFVLKLIKCQHLS